MPQFGRRSLMAAGLAAAPMAAGAQAWPGDRPISFIIPFPPGGGTDVMVRAMIPYLEKHLPGARFVVLNRPGAGAEVGYTALAMAPPDGLTIGVVIVPSLQTITIERSPRYRLEDFAYLGSVVDDPGGFFVAPDSPLRTAGRSGGACAGQSGQGGGRHRRDRLGRPSADDGIRAAGRGADGARALRRPGADHHRPARPAYHRRRDEHRREPGAGEAGPGAAAGAGGAGAQQPGARYPDLPRAGLRPDRRRGARPGRARGDAGTDPGPAGGDAAGGDGRSRLAGGGGAAVPAAAADGCGAGFTTLVQAEAAELRRLWQERPWKDQ